MKQIAFVSGKGGTGKSTLVSSLNILVNNKIIADCDVDAPNLHILIKGETLKETDYYGMKEAVINKDLCIECEKCIESCRFQAISKNIEIIPMKCEGCGVCVLVCPTDAVKLESVKTGVTSVVKSDRGILSHALLDVGAEGSGKLVMQVRKNVEDFIENEKWVLIDGSPGIGCVVIASITGTDAVVAVTEPTLSGLSDLERVLGVVRHFGIPGFVCINKYDLNNEISEQIEKYCVENNFTVIGKIPFDKTIVKALQEFKTPIEYGDSMTATAITNIWSRLQEEMKKL